MASFCDFHLKASCWNVVIYLCEFIEFVLMFCVFTKIVLLFSPFPKSRMLIESTHLSPTNKYSIHIMNISLEQQFVQGCFAEFYLAYQIMFDYIWCLLCGISIWRCIHFDQSIAYYQITYKYCIGWRKKGNDCLK